jgi:predicted dehydrogenase
MKAPIGIGFLSFAHGHTAVYADVMTAFDDTRLVAAWDDDEARGRAKCDTTGMRFSPDMRGVLEDPDVQAVIVGTETDRHADTICAAAEAGKHILCQKPLALSLAECDRIIAATEKAGVRFAMAWQMRHDPANQAIREVVRSGRLGKIGLVRRRHCIGVCLNPDFASTWHVSAKHNLGMFADDASHPADWFNWTFGKPVSVIAEIDNILSDMAPDDNGVAVYRWADGMMGVLVNSSTVRAAEATTELYGDKGVLIQSYGDSPALDIPKLNVGPAVKVFDYATNQWEDLGIPLPAGHVERLKNVPRPWIDALLNDTPLPATAQDGRVALEMVLAAYQSSKEGRRVSMT